MNRILKVLYESYWQFVIFIIVTAFIALLSAGLTLFGYFCLRNAWKLEGKDGLAKAAGG